MPTGIRNLERLLAWSLRTFSGLSRPLQLAVAFVGIVIVGAMDYRTGYEVSLSILYLLPITIATWFAGRRIGVIYALLCGLSWYVVVKATAEPFSHGWIPVWNDMVRIGFFLTHALLLDAFRRRLRDEQALARTDPLTGVLNSRAFDESLQHEFAMARRLGAPLTLAYVDLDHFKRINDNGGHADGDRILQACARHLRDSVRSTDEVARVGGDEFVLLMPDTNTDGAAVVVDKFAHKLATLRCRDDARVSCSIGAMTFIELPATREAMVAAADQLMYEVKSDGRGCAMFGEYHAQRSRIVNRMAVGPGT